MSQLSCTQLATVAQGYFGAKSPKATGFLCIQCTPDAASNKSRPFLPPLAAGRTTTGEFHSWKEYPPALCRALVELKVLAATLQEATEDEAKTIGPDFNAQGYWKQAGREAGTGLHSHRAGKLGPEPNSL